MRLTLIIVLFLVLVGALTAPASVAAFSGGAEAMSAANPAFGARNALLASRDFHDSVLRVALVGTQTPLHSAIPQSASLGIVLLIAGLVTYRRRPAPRPPTPESTDY